MLPHSNHAPQGLWLGRVERRGIGPSIVTLRGNDLIDITSNETPTMASLLDRPDVINYVRTATGPVIAQLDELGGDVTLLSPADVQAIKASGVTFAQSMVERVIEERAAGDADLAQEIRNRVTAVIGDSLSGIEPGSAKAMHVKEVLQREGMWSQYLEVGIGPDAEVFTKCQPMASVGWGADVGIHPMSTWNNPEPEIV
ncbi:MAG: fumarylacetoacetate hydrolase, partial [Rhodobacteraceae bacterium]|nr:fumarylacetoacetate hydrolase [Paracoccaceae bacterium]